MSNLPSSCWSCVLSKSKADEGCTDVWHCDHSIWGTLDQPTHSNDITIFVKDEKLAPWCPLKRCSICKREVNDVRFGLCQDCLNLEEKRMGFRNGV